MWSPGPGEGDQVPEFVEPGGGGAGGPVAILAEGGEHGAQLAESVFGDGLYGGQGGSGLLRLGVHEVQADGRLHVHERDVVADHVVKVAGHLQAFLVGPASSRPAGDAGLGHPFPAHAHSFGRDDQHRQPAAEDQGGIERGQGLAPDQRGEPQRPDVGDHDDGPGGPAVPAGGGEEEGDDQAQVAEARRGRPDRGEEGDPQHMTGWRRQVRRASGPTRSRSHSATSRRDWWW